MDSPPKIIVHDSDNDKLSARQLAPNVSYPFQEEKSSSSLASRGRRDLRMRVTTSTKSLKRNFVFPMFKVSVDKSSTKDIEKPKEIEQQKNLKSGTEDIWRKAAYDFFEKPQSNIALAFQYFSMFLALVSIVLYCCETLPYYMVNPVSNTLQDKVFPFETFAAIVWTIELLGRFYGAPSRTVFVSKIMSWVDLFSILPYFVQLGSGPSTEAVQFISILRLFRVFKLVKLSKGLIIVYRAMVASAEVLWLLFLSIIFLLITTSTAMYWAERGNWNPERGIWQRPDGSRSPFNSIPEGFYWSMTTLATVGYGDVVPITPLGKFFAAVTMLFSILTIALPTAVLGSNFLSEWQAMQMQRERRKSLTDGLKRGPSGSRMSIIDSRRLSTMVGSMPIPKEIFDILQDIKVKLDNLSSDSSKTSLHDEVNWKAKYAESQIKISELKDKIQQLEIN